MKLQLKRKQAWNDLQKQTVVPFPKTVSADMKTAADADLTVVAFHTDDAFYTHEARRMAASARRLGLKAELTVVSNQGDWVKNTSMKAGFLAQARRDIRGPILYVDVDSVFHRSPAAYLTQLDCDVAVHYDHTDGHLMSGTLYFPDTPQAAHLIDTWAEQCRLRPGVWDQEVLEDVLHAGEAGQTAYRVHPLPVVFCWVFDREANSGQAQGLPVYIEQLQASREVRDNIKAQEKKSLVWRRNSKTQRRLDRLAQIEAVLLPRRSLFRWFRSLWGG